MSETKVLPDDLRPAGSVGRGRVAMFTRDRQIDRRILLEADTLEADGWSVSIFAVPADGMAEPDDRRVVRIGGASTGDGPSAGSGTLLRAYQGVGRFLPVNSRWLMALRAIVLSLYRGGPGAFVERLFARVIEETRADVYVAHDLPMLSVAVAAVERYGGKLVYDSHELFAEQEFTSVEKRMWHRLEKRYIGRCDLVITINPSIARELERRYPVPSVQVIHNAERVDARVQGGRLFHERLGLSPRVRILLFQGGLSEGRNLDMLIRMIPFVRTQDLHLVFLGNGVLADNLSRLAVKLGVNSRVHLIPAVPQHRLLEYTASADAGVIPYRANCLNSFYCTPNKLFEFIAAGIPMIATDLPELRRLIGENRIGLIGDTGAPDGIARLVDEMFREPDGVGRFDDALSRARKRINWQNESQRLVQMYRGLIESDGPGDSAGDSPLAPDVLSR